MFIMKNGNYCCSSGGEINKVRNIPNARPRTLAQFPAWGIRRSLSYVLTDGKIKLFILNTKKEFDFLLDVCFKNCLCCCESIRRWIYFFFNGILFHVKDPPCLLVALYESITSIASIFFRTAIWGVTQDGNFSSWCGGSFARLFGAASFYY